MNVINGVVVFMLAVGAIGCRDSIDPSPVSPSVEASPNQVYPVQSAGVADTAFQPIAGAEVEIVSGPQAGTSLFTDENGRIQLTGMFLSTDTFRASKEGYGSVTRGFTWSAPNGRPWLAFNLEPLSPAVDIAGDYTLTLDADSTCSTFPEELRSRSYAATITPTTTPTGPSNSSLELTVTNAPTLVAWRNLNGFRIGVAGQVVYFDLHGGHDPSLVEQLDRTTYLAYSGSARTTVSASAPATISAPFDGWIDYCMMRSPMGLAYICGTDNDGNPIPGASVTRNHCESPNHRLTLTRR